MPMGNNICFRCHRDALKESQGIKTTDVDKDGFWHGHACYAAPCVCIPCPNFKLCGFKELKGYASQTDGVCDNCVNFFGTWAGGPGKLTFLTGVECPVCFETGEAIVFPMCTHAACITCFKRIHYGDMKIMPAKPIFPLGKQAEQEFHRNVTDPRYRTPAILRYALEITAWMEVMDEIGKKQAAEFEGCPICRSVLPYEDNTREVSS
jgi:hypothetical protein